LAGGGRKDSGGVIMLIAAITAPIAAILIQLAISRSREYKADEEGAMIIGRPLSLANALQKLEVANAKKPIQNGNPASASLWIVNPFKPSSLVNIFSTHPPIAERVKRLRLMANKMGQL
jgi:heat shock protein HtpX